MSVTIGLVGLGFVALFVPLVVVAFQYLPVLAVPFAAVLAWLAWLCLGLVLARAELRIDGSGISAVGRRRRQKVTWAWDSVGAVGFVTLKGHEYLAVRLVESADPKLKFFLYPTWSDDLRAIVLGRIDSLSVPRSEIQQALERHGRERWQAELEPAS